MEIAKIKYIPNNFDWEKYEKLHLTKEQFVNLQIKYRRLFEQNVVRFIDFSQIEGKLKQAGFPVIDDKDHNFYSAYNTLPTEYIYLRNNIHIENLTPEELTLLMNSDVGLAFFQQTFDRVLYEKEDYTFIGEANDSTRVPSRSIIFTVAVDYAELEDFDLAVRLESLVENLDRVTTKEIELILCKALRQQHINAVIRLYDGMPDVFLENSFGVPGVQ